MKKNVTVVVLLVIISMIGYGFYMYNKKTPSLENVEPDFTLTANELFENFNTDETKALEKYEGKIIQVSGTILSFSQTDSISNLVLDAKDAMFGAVNCSFTKQNEIFEKGDEIEVKGECQGYLSSVIMNNCVVIKK